MTHLQPPPCDIKRVGDRLPKAPCDRPAPQAGCHRYLTLVTQAYAHRAGQARGGSGCADALLPTQ